MAQKAEIKGTGRQYTMEIGMNDEIKKRRGEGDVCGDEGEKRVLNEIDQNRLPKMIMSDAKINKIRSWKRKRKSNTKRTNCRISSGEGKENEENRTSIAKKKSFCLVDEKESMEVSEQTRKNI